MSELYLKLLADVFVIVTSDGLLPVSASERLLLGAYLPDVEILDSKPDHVDMTIKHTQSDEPSLTTSDATIEISDAWHGQFPDDLPHLLYSVSRQLWQERGYYPVHAACVTNGEQTVLLPAHSGAGKSTVVLNLVGKHGYKLVSGNTTLIRIDEAGNLVAVAGTRTMTLRTEDYDNYGVRSKNSVSYGNRTAFVMPEASIERAPATITHVAMIRLAHGVWQWNELGGSGSVHMLYPFMVDGEFEDCVIAGGRALFAGNTPESVRTTAAQALGKSSGKLTVYTGKGELDKILERIVGL